MRLKNIALAGALLAASGMAMADGAKPVGSGPNPYSDCGIGAALFSGDDIKWAAVTSNVTWDLGTTAVTSATMSPETCTRRNLVAAQFILDSYETLAEETARGEGEHISAMLQIFECDAAQQAQIMTGVRSDMSKQIALPAYDAKGAVEKASDYYNSVHGAVSTYCAA